jgi:hypothetical protein
VRNEDKSLLLPRLAFVEMEMRRGGFYRLPYAGEMLLEGRFYDCSKGLIVVNASQPVLFARTLAHEWRHHWQTLHGWSYDGIQWDQSLPYDRMLLRYLRTRSEGDAFRFAYRHVRDEMSGEQRAMLIRLGYDVLTDSRARA